MGPGGPPTRVHTQLGLALLCLPGRTSVRVGPSSQQHATGPGGQQGFGEVPRAGERELPASGASFCPRSGCPGPRARSLPRGAYVAAGYVEGSTETERGSSGLSLHRGGPPSGASCGLTPPALTDGCPRQRSLLQGRVMRASSGEAKLPSEGLMAAQTPGGSRGLPQEQLWGWMARCTGASAPGPARSGSRTPPSAFLACVRSGALAMASLDQTGGQCPARGHTLGTPDPRPPGAGGEAALVQTSALLSHTPWG